MTVEEFVAWVYPEACKGEISPVFSDGTGRIGVRLGKIRDRE